MNKPIGQYLHEASEAGITDFRLRIFRSGKMARIYIHPYDQNGETVDYYVIGNLLLPYANEGFATAFQRFVSGLQDPMPNLSCPLCHSVIGDVLYERPWFVALRGGMTPGTHNEPAEPYVEGVQLCPECGYIWEAHA